MKLKDQFKSLSEFLPFSYEAGHWHLKITRDDLKMLGILVLVGIVLWFIQQMSHPVCHSDYDTCQYDYRITTY